MAGSTGSLTTSTLFQTGPTDNIESVDIYGATTRALHNAYQTKTVGYIDSLFKGISLGKGSLFSTVKTVFSKDFMKLDAKDKMTSLLGNFGVNVNSIAESVQNNLLKDVGVDPAQVMAYTNKVGDTITNLKNHDWESITGDFALLSGFLGNNVITDLIHNESLIAYARNLLEIAEEWRLPETIDYITKYLKDQSSDIAHSVYQRFGTSTRATYNVDILDKLLSSDPSAAQSLCSKNPSLPDQVIRNFTLTGITADKYQEYAERLERVLNKLAPDYLTALRDNERCTNLYPFTIASSDAKKVLGLIDRYYPATLMGSKYPKEKASAIVKRYYPLAAISV